MTGGILEPVLLNSDDLTFVFPLNRVPWALTSLLTHLPLSPLGVKMISIKQYHSKSLTSPFLLPSDFELLLCFPERKKDWRTKVHELSLPSTMYVTFDK